MLFGIVFVISSLALFACGGDDGPQQSAPASVIENTGGENTAVENTVVENTVVENTAVENTVVENTAVENTSDGNDAMENEDESTQDTEGESVTTPDIGASDREEAGETEPDNDDPAAAIEAGLSSLLPSPSAIEDTTTSGYSTLDELISRRSEQPPLLRCGAGEDPTSLVVATGGRAAGRTFDYADGLRTTTVQLWEFVDPATASRAIALISALRCDRTPIGPITIGDTTYEQFDTAQDAQAGLGGDGVDEAVGASFERRLDATDATLIVQEELQFARVGATVVFAGAREIRSPDSSAAPPVDDASRVGALTTRAVLALAGQAGSEAGSIDSPAKIAIGSASQTGTYRSVTSSFCLVEIERATGQSAQITWGAGEQAIVTISTGDASVELGEGCGVWIPLVTSTAISVLSPGAAGTLLVGIDVPAASLLVTSTGACTVDQLTGFSGAPTDLLSSTILAPGESVQIDLGSAAGIYLGADCKY